MPNPNLIALDTMGQIEACNRDIADLQERLERIPLWQPGAILARQAAEARRMISGMQERLDGHLVATLIGPSGAGKSTIFNALAGSDDLSPVGLQRPTTRDLVVLAAGKGTRMGPGKDKLFLEVAGWPVVAHGWRRFDRANCIQHVVAVVRRTDPGGVKRGKPQAF